MIRKLANILKVTNLGLLDAEISCSVEAGAEELKGPELVQLGEDVLDVAPAAHRTLQILLVVLALHSPHNWSSSVKFSDQDPHGSAQIRFSYVRTNCNETSQKTTFLNSPPSETFKPIAYLKQILIHFRITISVIKTLDPDPH